jgi:glycosyltransferase involved in cell wall biosynthesis
MPSLLAVAAVDHPGGAEIGLLRLLPRLRDRGWEVTLTTPGDGPMSDAGSRLGLRCERLDPGGLARGAGAAAVRSWPAARRLASAHDVVYLNGTVCGRLLPALPRRVHRVLHVHDIVTRTPRWWGMADVMLADSQAVADELAPLDAHVVGCPIEPDPPAVDAPWPPGEQPVVGYVGRIEPRKGVLDLARAAPRVPARVVVVGNDPFAADRTYVDEVDRAPGIERYDWVDGAAGLMGALDVLVLPSHQEPFGTVLAEAMNAGTPVVATRVGGIPEVVEDGVTGRLSPPGDPEALAAAIAEVLERRGEMGAAGPARARRWHADAYAERVAELIAP